MNRYSPSRIRRIEDALTTPTNMLVRVLNEPHGVWPELQPEVGKIYPAVRGAHNETYKTKRNGNPFCYIRVKDHLIVLRRGSAELPDEYEEVACDG